MLRKLKSSLNKLYNHLFFYSYRSKPAKEVFKDIYERKRWSGESFSGPGSDLDETRIVRKSLREVIDQYHIKSILDIPCGDWFWMQHVDLSGISYTGADIVEEIINDNQKYAATDLISFKLLDLLEDELPNHDLIFCRDCLVHFSYKDIRKALKNMIASGSKFLLTTTFTSHSNYDIITGNWRPLNLEAPPVELPKPLLIINEDCKTGKGRYKDKSLALWDLRELKSLEESEAEEQA